MQARRIEMRPLWHQAQTHGRRRGHAPLEFRHPILRERLQGTTERLIIALGGRHAGRHEPCGGLLGEELGD